MKTLLKILLSCLLITITAALSFSIYAVKVTANVKFDKTKLVSYKENTVFYDNQGNLMTDMKGDPETIRITELPSHVKHSFVAIEDKRFYSHKGVDVKRILGATRKNIFSRKIKEGASTISQQLIKNTHLTGEKTIKRKLKEIKLTKELEKNYTKDEILEMYLNTIYFGENSYGIQSASKTYFNKNADELEIAESALLAAIIKAPSSYSPFYHPQSALKRRNLVINQMNSQGYITNSECKEGISSPLSINEIIPFMGQYYLTCVKNQAAEILEGTPYSINDSLNIYTYFNKDLCQIAKNELSNILPDCNYCLLLTDNKTKGVQTVLTDVGLIKRCPASTVKPWLIYAPCIEEKEITIATKILDNKTDFNGFYPCNNGGVYHGYISAETALIKSLNIPAVKLASCLGADKLKQYGEKLNVNTEGGLGIALGDIKEGMNMKEICDCYSVFSNNGKYTQSSFIKKITDKKGKVIYKHTPSEAQVFSDSTAYIINNTLKKCTREGTAKKINIGLPICAKTGTNGNENGNFDAYAISYCNEYTLGVWLGNSDNTLMNNHISGGTYPSIISCEIWKNIDKLTPVTDFSMPESVLPISIDKEKYEKDYVLIKGEGPTFLFASGTEPPDPFEITDIRQCIDNKTYTLLFTFSGYHGAEVYCLIGDKKTLLADCTKSPATATTAKQPPFKISIHPYTLNKKGEKTYGKTITLDNKKRPPIIDQWWDDNGL